MILCGNKKPQCLPLSPSWLLVADQLCPSMTYHNGLKLSQETFLPPSCSGHRDKGSKYRSASKALFSAKRVTIRYSVFSRPFHKT